MADGLTNHVGERENLRVSGQIITHAWLDANRRLVFNDQVTTDEGSATLAFAHLDGLATGTAKIDSASWRPTVRLLQGLDSVEPSMIMEGTMDDVPGWYPASITTDQVDSRHTRTTWERVEPLDAAPAAAAAGIPADTTFDDTCDSRNITFHPRAITELDMLSGRRTRAARQGSGVGRVALPSGRLLERSASGANRDRPADGAVRARPRGRPTASTRAAPASTACCSAATTRCSIRVAMRSCCAMKSA